MSAKQVIIVVGAGVDRIYRNSAFELVIVTWHANPQFWLGAVPRRSLTQVGALDDVGPRRSFLSESPARVTGIDEHGLSR